MVVAKMDPRLREDDRGTVNWKMNGAIFSDYSWASSMMMRRSILLSLLRIITDPPFSIISAMVAVTDKAVLTVAALLRE